MMTASTTSTTSTLTLPSAAADAVRALLPMTKLTVSSRTGRTIIIARLSDDIALQVLSFMDVHILCCMLQSCKRFHRLASEDFLWHALLKAELGESNLPPPASASGSWFRRFWQWQRLDACGYEEQQAALPAEGESPKV